MNSLPIFVRLAGRPVILLGQGDAAAAKRRLLERAGARIVGEDDSAALAIVAIEDEGEALAAIGRLKARGILVNATDRAELCDFTLPAIVDREPLVIAIGTGGASAGLAKALRQRLETLLPQSLGRLATGLESARDAIRSRWPDATARRKAIDAALDENGPLDPLRNIGAGAVDQWLQSIESREVSGFARYVLNSDDPDQLTLEQARALGQADAVIHSKDIAPAILARARADAVRIEDDNAPDLLPDGFTVQLVRQAS